jgi:hypothetical protein
MFVRGPHLIILLSLVSGLVGGLLAAFLLASTSVVAQSAPADAPTTTDAGSPKTISAEEFRLIDSQGRVRALLTFTENGQPYLQMRDEFDTSRVWIGISTDTGMALRDVDGKTRLVLSLDEQGEPSLVVRDRQHRMKSFQP